MESKEAHLESQDNVQQETDKQVLKTPATAVFNNLNSKITRSGGIDSGNDHNYQSDTSVMTSPPTTARLSSKTAAHDDEKRIQYQQRILQKMNEKRVNAETLLFKTDPSAMAASTISEFSSSSSTSIDSHTQRVEERKRELLKRFNIQIDHESSNMIHSASAAMGQSQKKIPRAPPTFDSGHFSSSSTNFSKIQSSQKSNLTRLNQVLNI